MPSTRPPYQALDVTNANETDMDPGRLEDRITSEPEHDTSQTRSAADFMHGAMLGNPNTFPEVGSGQSQPRGTNRSDHDAFAAVEGYLQLKRPTNEAREGLNYQDYMNWRLNHNNF
ncbi:uncharacterized protein DSM5745_00987 [Aspergillus mulundensis]|uniref:Uncharacterized protein n=1 Tax=Aspergillus mulundensis TaxID=1810919 RepID=A0A3D8T533_9EURO|nr:hypothetical protein DSM5745_00987 [Aspergillus mulundensis]RDW93665.1 hypothetical protein DSM5745_00987 [Aspergillus mulundensis]